MLASSYRQVPVVSKPPPLRTRVGSPHRQFENSSQAVPTRRDARTRLRPATLFGFKLRVAVPDGFEPDAGLYLDAEARAKDGVRRIRDPYVAVRGADMIYTDTWTSMGQEREAESRRIAFSGYTVDERMLAAAVAVQTA